jgi:hypothetical protein
LARTFAPDVAVYACDPSRGLVHVAATHPPSVLVSTLDDCPARLVFRIARAMHLARPENILVSTRDPEEGRLLMRAIQGAFGPHDPGAPIDSDAASLAADLWHTIASRDQADIRHALRADMLDFDTLAALVFGHAAVVGLLASGRVSAALSGLMLDEPALLALDESDPEARFDAACSTSPAFQSVLRWALTNAAQLS